MQSYNNVTPLNGGGDSTVTRFTPAPARVAFAAALSVYVFGGVAQAQVQAPPDVVIAQPGPATSPGLQFDFRCPGDGQGPDCSIFEIDGGRVFLNTAVIETEDEGELVVQRIEFFDGAEFCFTDSGTELALTGRGVGVNCIGDEDEGPGIGVGESVAIEFQFNNGEGFSTDARSDILGAYVSGVNAETVDGDCESDTGFFELVFDGSQSSVNVNWQAPSDQVDEITQECEVEGEQILFVPFPDIGAPIQEIRLVNTTGDDESSVFFLGTEDCDGGTLTSDSICATNLLGNGVPAFPLPPGVPEDERLQVFATPEAQIEVVDYFRVEDSRAACRQAGPPTANTDLPLGSGATVDEYVAYRPVVDETGYIGADRTPAALSVALTILGSDVFTVSKKACGVPRLDDGTEPDPAGEVVARDDPRPWTPFIDVIQVEADFDPVVDTTEFRTGELDPTPFACRTGQLPVDDAGTLAIDQPFFEINARPGEIKYVKNVIGPVVDPVGRDIMYECGSKRGSSRRWSYLAYNVIHAPDADLYAETSAEIGTLVESINRVAACVDPSYQAQVLLPQSAQIAQYFSLLPLYNGFGFGGFIYDAVASLVSGLEANVEANTDKFGFCFSMAPDYVNVLPVTATPGSLDKPLNAYGDIFSQLQHIDYVLSTFRASIIDDLP